MSDSPEQDVLNPERFTWSALLSQCVQMAQAAVALPVGDGEVGREGRAWRASVSHVIALQAVWFALQRRDELPADERALARDRAGVALEREGNALRLAWSEANLALPEGLASLIADVEAMIV